jgi:hypothetical protein
MAVATMPRCREGAHTAAHECGLGTLERVRYFQRQLLTADDMLTDQDYFREKMRRHNRLLHGTGVVCGLDVTAAPDAEAPWRVRIGEGYALGPQGDEISVPGDVFVDLARCGPGVVTDPCDPARLHGTAVAGRRGQVFVAIRYAECLTRPVRSGAGCGCDDIACEYSRVRDSFELECIDDPAPFPEAPDPCARWPLPCPPCPDDPWVVLARVTLPASLEDEMADAQIDNRARRALFSSYAIQERLIRCCCGHDDEPVPVRVVTVVPANGAVIPEAQPGATVTVTFDKDVQAGTVNTHTILVTVTKFSASGPQPVTGTVTYDTSTRTATFRPKSRFARGDYKVRVVGADAQHVTDVDQLALDGNKDGTGGDDFTSGFTVSADAPVPE